MKKTMPKAACLLALATLAALASCSAPAPARAPDPAVVLAHSDGLVARTDPVSVVLGAGRDPARLAGTEPSSLQVTAPRRGGSKRNGSVPARRAGSRPAPSTTDTGSVRATRPSLCATTTAGSGARAGAGPEQEASAASVASASRHAALGIVFVMVVLPPSSGS